MGKEVVLEKGKRMDQDVEFWTVSKGLGLGCSFRMSEYGCIQMHLHRKYQIWAALERGTELIDAT
jgi:hypothetical protein